MNFTYEVGTLKGSEYVELVKSVGWKTGKDLILSDVDKALNATSYTVVARDSRSNIVAAGRAFSDDLTMTFIPDILVRPDFQRMGLGREILGMIKGRYGHTIFYFGGQPSQEEFYEKLGFKKGMTSFTGRFSPNAFFD